MLWSSTSAAGGGGPLPRLVRIRQRFVRMDIIAGPRHPAAGQLSRVHGAHFAPGPRSVEHRVDSGRLKFFGDHAALAAAQAFAAYLAPLRKTEWVVYAKKPFGGPQEVLAYLSRYTHRVAIANSRLIACDHNGVTFKWKDYRAEGPARYKVMTLATKIGRA